MPWLALDAQLRSMALRHMLDNGQTQASTACFARTAAVNSVKPLRQARQMLCGDAGATVPDAELARPSSSSFQLTWTWPPSGV